MCLHGTVVEFLSLPGEIVCLNIIFIMNIQLGVYLEKSSLMEASIEICDATITERLMNACNIALS